MADSVSRAVAKSQLTIQDRENVEKPTGEMSPDEVKSRVEGALRDLWRYDSYLLEKDVSERAITHRLAIYLESRFPDYHVDCEYNRNRQWPKSYREIAIKISEDLKEDLTDPDILEEGKARTAFPDIIVHWRGGNAPTNLLIIEVKKAKGKTQCIDRMDDVKLRAFTSEDQEYKYWYGLALQLPVKDYAMKYGKANLFWIERGEDFTGPKTVELNP